ncbi:MAG: hypothetical protein JW969_06740 [Spirochaetales bacterium]|nr:hypothetical protein [Spirochaetales bacterium]
MKKTILYIYIILCLLVSSFYLSADGFSLVDKKKAKLDLNLRFAALGGYNLTTGLMDGAIQAAQFNFNGELDKFLDFKFCFEAANFNKLPENDYSVLFQDVYIEENFHEYFRLREGRFKAPFGEEIKRSLGERPYAERTRTSKSIPPGRGLGVMASGRKIFGLFGYDVGVQYGSELEKPDDAVNELCTAGKVYLRYNPDSLDLRFGYNAYYDYFEYTVPNHKLAHGMFLNLEWEPAKKQKLSLLAEYQERLKIRNVVNPISDWARGIIGYLSYRIDMVEPFVLVNFHDESLLANDANDIIGFTTGAAAYFMDKDLLQLKLNYSLEYGVFTGASTNNICLMVQMEY